MHKLSDTSDFNPELQRVFSTSEAAKFEKTGDSKIVNYNGRSYEYYDAKLHSSTVATIERIIHAIFLFIMGDLINAWKEITNRMVVCVEVKGTAIKDIASDNWATIGSPTSEPIDIRAQISELITRDALSTEIMLRQQEILRRKEEFRPKIEQEKLDKQKSPSYAQLQELSRNGTLQPAGVGSGGVYFLQDEQGKSKFVIKPHDEAAFCLHNPRKQACPLLNDSLRTREDIPAYESAQNEALGSSIAELINARNIVPETVLTIYTSDQFHLISDSAGRKVKSEPNEREKLCSAQKFIEGAETADDYCKRKESEKNKAVYDPSKIVAVYDPGDIVYDPHDFEMGNIYIWVSGNEDATRDNFMVSEEPGREGAPVHLQIIDSSLICGDRGPIGNELAASPQMKSVISLQGRDSIKNISTKALAAKMRFFGKSEASIAAAVGRVKMMQAAIKNDPNITLGEMNKLVKNNYAGLPS